jgi:hypothetical protein
MQGLLFYRLLKYTFVKLLFLFIYVSLYLIKMMISDCVLVSQSDISSDAPISISFISWTWNSYPAEILCFCFLLLSVHFIGTFRSQLLDSNSYMPMTRLHFLIWHSTDNLERSLINYRGESAPLIRVQAVRFLHSSFLYVVVHVLHLKDINNSYTHARSQTQCW